MTKSSKKPVGITGCGFCEDAAPSRRSEDSDRFPVILFRRLGVNLVEQAEQLIFPSPKGDALFPAIFILIVKTIQHLSLMLDHYFSPFFLYPQPDKMRYPRMSKIVWADLSDTSKWPAAYARRSAQPMPFSGIDFVLLMRTREDITFLAFNIAD